jgi:hypothetical protein
MRGSDIAKHSSTRAQLKVRGFWSFQYAFCTKGKAAIFAFAFAPLRRQRQLPHGALATTGTIFATSCSAHVRALSGPPCFPPSKMLPFIAPKGLSIKNHFDVFRE